MQIYYWKLGWQKIVVWSIFPSLKAFAKAIFFLKATVEALDRLWFDMFVEETYTEIRPQAFLDTILTCNKQRVDSALNDESTNCLIQVYVEFKEQLISLTRV